MIRKPAASRRRNMTYPFDCVQMANRGTGYDGRGRIWGEGMDWTGRGLGYRSDEDDGNGNSEMFGHDRSPLQRTRSFLVYGNMIRVREESLASIGPSRNWDQRHQHDQSVQSHRRPDQNRATEGLQDQGAENTLNLLHDAERKIIRHSGGHTKFSQGERPNFNKSPIFKKGKGRGFGGQANNRGNTGVCYTCDQPGHISRFCPKHQWNNQRSNQQGYSSIRMEDVTCFSCGMKGHYASSCPNKPIPSTPLAIRAPPSRPAIEPAPKKQNLGGRVYALGVENPDNEGPSSGPITGEPLALDCLGWDSEGLYLLVGDCNSLSNARLLTPHSLLFSGEPLALDCLGWDSVTSSELVEVAGG
ncbi:hypothetical protein F2Q69_00052464 [Brassica cretica]|uniref:CCHC-type domain-containing protein n=1 Tax=Brassica cretica TaxID=69181 RepID=A0A8S9NCC8_BRACR|nr:hypothetical protein F2Q69_00052464 [Brassica cretica]